MNVSLKSVVVAITALGLMGSFSSLRADDVSGRIALSGIAGAGWPLGQKSVKNAVRNVGPDLGGMLSYGVLKNLDLGVSYENIDLGHGRRVEPILANAIIRLMPDSRLTPTLLAGAGVGRGIGPDVYNRFSAKGGLGLQYFATPDFSLGPQVNFLHVAQRGSTRQHVNELTAGLFGSYFFGGKNAPAAPKAAPAPVAAAPEPVKAAPAAIAVALTPAQATLGSNQAQGFTATVSGSDNQNVTWSLSPQLGTITNGQYMAPATIALPETVTVTATSVADTSKSASSIIKLTPPVTAAKEVSINLNVLFDTAKDVVKPQYDAEIQKVADFMKSYPSANAVIEGHTDSMGSEAMNVALSQRRADAVKNELIQKFSVPANRLSSKGFGPAKPIADNKTAAGRAQNRRVVATLSAVAAQ